MNKIVAHLRSSNVITALGIGAALLVYWFTNGNAELAGVAAVAVMGSVPSSTMAMISKLESLEDSIRSGYATPVTNVIPPDVTHTSTVGDASVSTSGSAAAVLKVIEATKPVATAMVVIGLLCCLQACSGSNVATVNLSLATAQTDAQNAVALYGISKGIADAAVLVNPALAPAIAKIEAVADPVAAKLQIAVTDATADAAAVEVLVAQIQTQANTLTVQTAGSVTVVPNGSKPQATIFVPNGANITAYRASYRASFPTGCVINAMHVENCAFSDGATISFN